MCSLRQACGCVPYLLLLDRTHVKVQLMLNNTPSSMSMLLFLWWLQTSNNLITLKDISNCPMKEGCSSYITDLISAEIHGYALHLRDLPIGSNEDGLVLSNCVRINEEHSNGPAYSGSSFRTPFREENSSSSKCRGSSKPDLHGTPSRSQISIPSVQSYAKKSRNGRPQHRPVRPLRLPQNRTHISPTPPLPVALMQLVIVDVVGHADVVAASAEVTLAEAVDNQASNNLDTMLLGLPSWVTGPTQLKHIQTGRPWPLHPCPYPTSNKQPQPNTGQGILGPRPTQAYPMGYTPIDIDHALYTMSLHPPERPWFMDTGASNHMTNNPGSQDQGAYPPQQ